MSRACFLPTAFATVTMCATPLSAEEEPTTIPLKAIWAYEMPGTRDVRELEPDKFGKAIEGLSSDEQLKTMERSHVSHILQSLEPANVNQARQRAFAVVGTGAKALGAARSVLAEGEKPRSSLPAESELSVVFFSRRFGYYVHIHEVRLQDNTIEISYRFEPHRTKEVTSHFALIPVGKLEAGFFEVAIVQVPMKQTAVNSGFQPPASSIASRVVSGPFRFEVEVDGCVRSDSDEGSSQ